MTAEMKNSVGELENKVEEILKKLKQNYREGNRLENKKITELDQEAPRQNNKYSKKQEQRNEGKGIIKKII